MFHKEMEKLKDSMSCIVQDQWHKSVQKRFHEIIGSKFKVYFFYIQYTLFCRQLIGIYWFFVLPIFVSCSCMTSYFVRPLLVVAPLQILMIFLSVTKPLPYDLYSQLRLRILNSYLSFYLIL